MPFFSKLFIFTAGIISGTYIDQNYKLPNVEEKAKEYYHILKTYEPPKKEVNNKK